MDKINVYQTDKGKSNYKIKGEKIDGLRIEITALYERPITIGDKISNRHANKGIISTIVPEEQMPPIDGKRADVVLNPLGICSRMNVGQSFELHLSKSLMDLKELIKEKLKKESYKHVKEYNISHTECRALDKRKTKMYHKMIKDHGGRITAAFMIHHDERTKDQKDIVSIYKDIIYG